MLEFCSNWSPPLIGHTHHWIYCIYIFQNFWNFLLENSGISGNSGFAGLQSLTGRKCIQSNCELGLLSRCVIFRDWLSGKKCRPIASLWRLTHHSLSRNHHIVPRYRISDKCLLSSGVRDRRLFATIATELILIAYLRTPAPVNA